MNSYRPQQGRLRAFVARLLPRDLRASFDEDDLVQETLAAAWLNRATIDKLDLGARQTWMRTVARRKLIDRIRRRDSKKRKAAEGEALDAAQQLQSFIRTPSSAAAVNEASELLTAALSQLSDRHQLVIRLRYFDGKQFREVAGEMDISEEAAQMLLNRAVANLRKAIGRESQYFG